ncbi:gamma-aminobutyric acid receptor subunit beta-1-like [Xenia sp. Carnegie-2017]|uniref:gamma-aminobutyric acid receptor subunit beta-1-like n=1 Tax=Xenia sp. Carnegie-2017 TaxID=2897299 RepID=UPI001F04E2AF|nr:gamma-aminobutyric acid receptor subunit beta-1-like [Xenia sp. Carnegie-2017]
MDHRKFPIDSQSCNLNFLSYAYATTLLQFSLKKQETEVRFIELQQFNYVGTMMHEDKEGGKGTTPSVTIVVQFERRLGYYIIQICIPSVFLVLLSWLSFFMDSEDIANRVTLEVTIIVAIVFLLTSSNSSMPTFLSYILYNIVYWTYYL